MLPELPSDWREQIGDEFEKEYFQKLKIFLSHEMNNQQILPSPSNIFYAFGATQYEKVRVVILGQDPYPTPGHAHGLAFSVLPNVRPLPGSLKNIYKELVTDMPGFLPPQHGNLTSWTEQGVLLLNTVLTVRAREANSHQKKGWEQFTDRIINLLNLKQERIVFVLWGKKAQAKTPLITARQHRIVASAHPSPLSVKLFSGSRPFSQINRHLTDAGNQPVDWQLPNIV